MKTTLRVRLIPLWGKLRRMFLNKFRPGYVRASLARRQGECKRCGACCRLAWRCRYLRYENGVSSCVIYDTPRLPNCCTFPIDRRDIADRDLVSPDVPCGYWWPEKSPKIPKA